MAMSLPDFISAVGVEKAASIFAIKPRTAESWRRRERYPRTSKAAEIITATNGAVDYAGIYGPSAVQTKAA